MLEIITVIVKKFLSQILMGSSNDVMWTDGLIAPEETAIAERKASKQMIDSVHDDMGTTRNEKEVEPIKQILCLVSIRHRYRCAGSLMDMMYASFAIQCHKHESRPAPTHGYIGSSRMIFTMIILLFHKECATVTKIDSTQRRRI